MKRNTKYVLNLYLCQKFVMRKVILILFLSIGMLSFGQNEPNRFEESELAVNTTKSDEFGNVTAKNGGNPAVPAPIDDYVPLLVLVATVLIYYVTYKKRPTP